MKSHTAINSSAQEAEPKIFSLLHERPWNETAIQAAINKEGIEVKIGKGLTPIHLFQNRLQFDFPVIFDERLEKLIINETKANASAEKLAYLNQLKNALPDLKDLLIANLKSGDITLLEAIRIHNSLSCVVEGVINGNLTEQHKESFELATAKLKNYPQWRVVLGLIIGAVVGLIAVASLTLGGVTIPVGVSIAGIMSTAFCGSIFGFLTRHKNTTKQIADSAVELTTFSEEKENNTINLQDYTPEQIALQKELMAEINKLLATIVSEKKSDPIKAYIKRTLLLMRKDVDDFKIFGKDESRQIAHYKYLIFIANKKFDYNKRLPIDNLTEIVRRTWKFCPKKLEEKIRPALTHKIGIESSILNSYVTLTSNHLLARDIPWRDFFKSCEKLRTMKNWDMINKTIDLDQNQFNDHVKEAEKTAGNVVQVLEDEISLDNSRYQEEIAQAKQKKQTEEKIDFMFELANEMEFMLLELDLDDKLAESRLSFTKLFSNNKTEPQIHHEQMKADFRLCFKAIKKLALENNSDMNQFEEILSNIREISAKKKLSHEYHKWASFFATLESSIYQLKSDHNLLQPDTNKIDPQPHQKHKEQQSTSLIALK